MKHEVTLEIAGARYKMTSDADEAHLQRLATMINERIAGLGPKAARTASPAQLLAVVALGLADDLLTAEDRRRQVAGVTRTAIASAIERIDARIEADAHARRQEEGGADGSGEGDAHGDDESR